MKITVIFGHHSRLQQERERCEMEQFDACFENNFISFVVIQNDAQMPLKQLKDVDIRRLDRQWSCDIDRIRMLGEQQ